VIDERRLREELREAPVPSGAGSERRAWETVASAYTELRRELPARRRHRLGTGLATAAAALVLAGLTLTPAGAAVREWIGDAIAPGRDDAKPALTRLPAAGELLVTSGAGAWVVHEDGSRRLLGDYDEATWSPHGRYVGVAAGRELSAVDPRGELRWSISRRRISDPRWSPNEGFRVAYLSGHELRVIWGDGTNDRALAAAAPVAPAWKPRAGSRNVLAYVDPRGRVRVVDADSGEGVGASPRFAGSLSLQWSRDGERLLLLTRSALRILDPAGSVLAVSRFPRGLEGVAAAFRPGTGDVVTIRRSVATPVRSTVVRTRFHDGRERERRLFAGVGRLSGLAYSPDGSRLLVGWPDADQWLFLPTWAGRVETVGNLSRQFDSGRADEAATFPRVDGWCCRDR
jgi:hypothetical protein